MWRLTPPPLPPLLTILLVRALLSAHTASSSAGLSYDYSLSTDLHLGPMARGKCRPHRSFSNAHAETRPQNLIILLQTAQLYNDYSGIKTITPITDACTKLTAPWTQVHTHPQTSTQMIALAIYIQTSKPIQIILAMKLPNVPWELNINM